MSPVLRGHCAEKRCRRRLLQTGKAGMGKLTLLLAAALRLLGCCETRWLRQVRTHGLQHCLQSNHKSVPDRC